MEASTKIFSSSTRHYISNSILLKSHRSLKSPLSHYAIVKSSVLPPLLNPSISLSRHSCNANSPVKSAFKPDPFSFPSTIFHSRLLSLNSSLSSDRFARIFSGSQLDSNSYVWHFTYFGCDVDGDKRVYANDEDSNVTVVLLGWLDAKPKHLRRYVEFYNSKGINAVTFVASVTDVLGFDLGKKLQARISRLSDEIAYWLSQSKRDGRKRSVIFHTFSNTGWLAYGAILDNLQVREDLLEKIKGCVVDSAGDPGNPKVWAAGFSAALLQKNSFPTLQSINGGKTGFITPTSTEESKPSLAENLLLFSLEKLFSFLLKLPDVNQRLTKIISTLSTNQPHPQLYLYSTADKVIPYQSVELFGEAQKRMGRKVSFYNFESSPHVDHYRSFKEMYLLQIENFLKECSVISEESMASAKQM